MNILALISTIEEQISKTTARQLRQVIGAMLSIPGRITMLGLSRWTEKGGSYRTIQRFYNSIILWKEIQWQIIQKNFLTKDGEYLLAGDETVVSKAGKQTYGIDRFFSGIQQRVIRSVAFFAISIIDVEKGRSYPIELKQVIRSEEEKAARKTRKEQNDTMPKRKRGRPKGSKNKANQVEKRSPELERIQNSLKSVLELIGQTIQLKFIALDGHFGNDPCARMVKELGLDLVSKLRTDAALYLPYHGEQLHRGRKRIYGQKLDLSKPPVQFLKSTQTEAGYQTDIFQGIFLNKNFSFPLNVVVIVKTNLKTLSKAYVVLFSTNLDLDYERLIRYYSLRFQIEFNFRDAKQHWGLEDFMNIKELPVTNAANFSLFMVNFSFALMQSFREHDPDFSILDLKSHFRGLRYASEIINILPQKPDNILLHQIFEHFARLGAIHPLSSPISSP
jgi:putative transposase